MSTQQNSKNLNKKIPPVFILLTSLILFIISRVIFSDESYKSSAIWALVDVAALLFFLLGIASSISSHFARKKAIKNNLKTKDINNEIKLRPTIKKSYYLPIILVIILISAICFILNSDKKEEIVILEKEIEAINVNTNKEVEALIFNENIETSFVDNSDNLSDSNTSKPEKPYKSAFKMSSEYLAARIVYLHCLQINGDAQYLESLYDGSTYSPNIEGSGVIVSSDGKILTNAHVVGLSSMCLVQVAKAPNYSVPSPQYYAVVKHIGKTEDLAELKIYKSLTDSLPLSFSYFEIDRSEINIGDTVYVAGFPYSGNGRLMLTNGIISGSNDLSGNISGSYLVTSAKIDNGNSGGAAISEDGKLIGLPTYIKGNYDTLGYILDLDRVGY